MESRWARMASPRLRQGLVTGAAVLSAAVTVLATVYLPGMVRAPGASAAGQASVQPGAAGPNAVPASDVSPATPSPDPSTQPQARNVVVLMADDLDWSTFNATEGLSSLRNLGTTLENFTVTDSLCCPSRTSLLRSQYLHNHRVLSNVPRTGGGWQKFYRLGHPRDNLPTWLSAKGVATAHVGKYLNGFPGTKPPTYVPPGWDLFQTTVNGHVAYSGYGYELATNGVVTKPPEFLNDLLTTSAINWMGQATEPFYLSFNSYLPHTPFPASPANTGRNIGAKAPRSPSFNVVRAGQPTWLADRPALSPAILADIDRIWSRRLDSTQTFADSVQAILKALEEQGRLDSTLVIVTSDNGYHLGNHRLATGKQTPFHEDTIVPTILIGTGIPAGQTIDQMTSMIDLAPTIASWLGAPTPSYVDGRDLLPLVQDPSTPWRTGVLTEHYNSPLPGDPDRDGWDAPPYRSLRTQDWLLVQYQQEAALYNLVRDPYEMTNVIDSTPEATLKQLRAQLKALSKCSGASCRVADRMPAPKAPGG